MKFAKILGLTIATVGLALAAGCSEDARDSMSAAGDKAADMAREATDTLEDNIERSGEILEETYEEGREKGENTVVAAGDAYDAVVNEPIKEEEEEAK